MYSSTMRALRRWGRKDILEATEESWDTVMGVNLKGPFFLSQRVAQEMCTRIASLTNPTIINVSSLSAYALSLNRGDYCISKAGMGMMTQLFAARHANDGIRVFELRPGIIETDMTAAGQATYTPMIADGLTPIRRWGNACRCRQSGGAVGQRCNAVQHRRHHQC